MTRETAYPSPSLPARGFNNYVSRLGRSVTVFMCTYYSVLTKDTLELLGNILSAVR